MLKFEIVEKIQLPTSVKLGKEAFEEIGKAVAKGITKSILDQKQADGSALQANKPKTTALKIAKGRTPKSLIDERKRFVKGGGNSFKVRADDISAEVTVADPHMADVARWLQEGGGGRNIYRGWFGISKLALEKIRRVTAKRVREILKDLK